MRQQWEFVGSTTGWEWRSTDADTVSTIQQSQACFSTLFECIKDAEVRGYKSASHDKRVYRIETQMS